MKSSPPSGQRASRLVLAARVTAVICVLVIVVGVVVQQWFTVIGCAFTLAAMCIILATK
jgi:hypothetical protein